MERRKHLAGIEQTLFVERAFDALLVLEIDLGEHHRHQVPLLDPDAMLAGEHAADLDAQLEDVGTERLRALQLPWLVGSGQAAGGCCPAWSRCPRSSGGGSPRPSPSPPTMTAVPSADSATEKPCPACPTAPVPTSLLPCWVQTPSGRAGVAGFAGGGLLAAAPVPGTAASGSVSRRLDIRRPDHVSPSCELRLDALGKFLGRASDPVEVKRF
jgi:hypothetical protein